MKIEQALSILGKDFEDFKVKGNVAHSPKFSICYHYSKMYDGKLASGSKKIRIKEERGKIVLYNNKGQDTYDVTEYLHRI